MNGENLLRAWEKTQGIYVHIPFCVQKCLYCDFTSFACCDKNFMEQYARAVCAEIKYQSERKPYVESGATIYFGGGTPSVMPTECIGEIATALKEYGFWRNPAEATIEVNPGTADTAKLRAFKSMGFDRVSFGVQSLNDAELKSIGRIHTAQEALAAINMAQKAGFARINADVIYGLPGQTLESLKSTLQRLTATGIEHLSVYGLIVEEETPLAKLLDGGKITLPDDDACADMYEFVQQFLAAHGFERYEISNYAKNGGFSRHNLVYWRYLPYAAFGAAACAFNGEKRRSGLSDVKSYVQNALTGVFCYDDERLTMRERMGEFMFMNLRKSEGVDLFAAKERFGIDFYAEYKKELDEFIERGLVFYDGESGALRLTEAGMEVGNQIFEIFVTV